MKKEKVFTNHIFDKKLIFKIYKEVLQLSSKTKQHPSLMRKGHKQTFLKRRQANGQQYNKRLSTLLIIREIQIRTVVRYHLTPDRISSVQSLSRVRLSATPGTSACQASLSITNSRSLLKLMSIESVIPSNHFIFCLPFSSCLQSFPASESFPMNQFFTSGGQSIGALASASVLPMNSQDGFPLGLTALISLWSKGLSRVFSNTTVQKHQFFGTQPSSQSSPHIHT